MRATMSMKPGPQDALTPPGPRFHGVTDWGRLALPAAMVLSGIVSVQAGAGIAARLLHEILPAACRRASLMADRRPSWLSVSGRYDPRLTGASGTWRARPSDP